MLERHAAARGPDGKSCLAVAAGRLGGLRNVERYGPAAAWGLRLALWRHHRVPLRYERSGDEPEKLAAVAGSSEDAC
jgi:hypothetical protein